MLLVIAIRPNTLYVLLEYNYQSSSILGNIWEGLSDLVLTLPCSLGMKQCSYLLEIPSVS